MPPLDDIVDKYALLESLEEKDKRFARESLLAFTRYTKPDYVVNWHHRLMCDYLDRFIRGDITRLMVFTAPGHGKSELTSRRLPAFLHGRFPDAEIMAASYSLSLANDMTADVQRIMDSEEYHAIFPGVRIPPPGSRDSLYARKQEEHHIIGRRGKYRGQGVGGAFTGKRARYIVIDDPIKGRQDADSPAFRDYLYSWYSSDLRSRLRSGGGQILITLTRWHDDDIAQRLLDLAKRDKDADQWTVLILPAFRENMDFADDPRELGGVLWPEAFPLSELNAIKASDPRGFNALYQQRPTAQEGNIFKREYWKYYRQLPDRFDVEIQSWDMAVKGKETGSRTVGLVMAKKGADKYVLDVVKGHMEFPIACNAVVALSAKWPKTHRKLVEDKANGPAVIATLQRRVSGLVPVAPDGDKVARANAVSADCESGNVWLPDPSLAPWVNDFVNELADFPNSKFNDQVDAFTQALSELRKIQPAYAPLSGHSGVMF